VRWPLPSYQEWLAAEETGARAAGELTAGSPRYRSHWATWVQALLLEAAGAVPEAFANLGGVWDGCARSGFALEYPVLGPDLVRLALAAGDPQRARQVAAAVEQVAAGDAVPWITGAALRCRGLARDDPGLLCAAVDAYAQGPRPFELALAAEDAGVAFARHGDPAAAAPLLQRALAAYERLDAARPAARAEAGLRQLGIRRGRRGARQRPQLGWGSLTPTEQRVVALVAEGLSNPQIGERLFVSRRTRPDPPGPRVRQAGHLLPHPARRRGRPPGGTLEVLSSADRCRRIGQLADVWAARLPDAGGAPATEPTEGAAMRPSAQRTAGIVAAAAAVALVLWAVARLLGVDLDVRINGDVRQVGPADVLVATVLAGLAAWVVHSILARTPRTARWWPFVGSTALAISMTGPSYLSDGADAVALMAMHLLVGATLIYGFATSQPSWPVERQEHVSGRAS